MQPLHRQGRALRHMGREAAHLKVSDDNLNRLAHFARIFDHRGMTLRGSAAAAGGRASSVTGCSRWLDRLSPDLGGSAWPTLGGSRTGGGGTGAIFRMLEHSAGSEPFEHLHFAVRYPGSRWGAGRLQLRGPPRRVSRRQTVFGGAAFTGPRNEARPKSHPLAAAAPRRQEVPGVEPGLSQRRRGGENRGRCPLEFLARGR